MKKPHELTEEGWMHFVMGNSGRTEEEIEASLSQLLEHIAQLELRAYLEMGGRLH